MARKAELELVEVEVRPGRPFKTILDKSKSRTITEIPPGGRFKVSRRAARAFADKLMVVGGKKRPQPKKKGSGGRNRRGPGFLQRLKGRYVVGLNLMVRCLPPI